MKSILVLIVMALSPAVFAGANCDDVSRFEKNPVQLAEMQTMASQKKVTIIDVNTAESFKKARIGNAVHFGANKGNLKKVLPADTSAPIVAYCGGTQCTAWKRAAMAACKAGYTNIRHFPAGITGWKAPKAG